MKIITVILACAIVGGCGNIAAQMPAQDDAKCQSFGAQPGSKAYYNCRMDLENQRSIRRTTHPAIVD